MKYPVPDPITGAVPLAQERASALLSKVIRECEGQRVLFDLDSTLLDNKPRSAVIMREFAEARSLSLLANATPAHFPTWSARDSMVLMGMSQAHADLLLDDYLDFWAARFFSSEYCHHDIGVTGSNRFVNAVHDSGGEVIYLTGRDETMREGTALSLETLGFPRADAYGVSLIMKPKASDSDDKYKQGELEKLSVLGDIAAGFDNEPSHINSYRRVFTKTVCVHLDTDHSMRKVRLLGGIVSIRDFEH